MTPRDIDGRPVVTINEAALLTGHTRRTIQNWLKRGWIKKAGILPSGRTLLFKDDLIREPGESGPHDMGEPR